MSGPSQPQNGDDGRAPDGSQPSGSPDPELSARLERLNVALDKARPKGETKPAVTVGDASAASGMSLAYRLGAEFVSAVLVGAGLGYVLDRALGIAPWGMIVLLLIGFAAGVLNMLRAAGETGKSKKPGP